MLSQTQEGENWLAQFERPDQEAATLLLDSLILVDQIDFEVCLEKDLDEFLKTHKGSVALYTAVERPKLGTRKRVIDKSKPFFPLKISSKNPNGGPENYAMPGDTGSEGLLAHFCRDYARKKSWRVFSHPGIATLRKKRVRWVICLDDVIGSGNRMREFVEWIYEDKTVRSWHSFGWIKFVVICYAASSVGQKVLKNVSLISEITNCHSIKKGRLVWSKEERFSIESLCKKYSGRYKLGMPLGYKYAFSMIMFSHGCPNTNPSVVWKNKSPWKALVQGTGRPGSLIKKGVSRKNQQERLLNILGQTRLTKPSLFQRLNWESRKILMFLSCVAMKKRKISVLSEMLDVPNSVVLEWRKKCLSLGWIGEDNILTSNGKYALAAAKRNKFTEGKELILKEDFYFPLSLRSPTNSSSIAPSTAEGRRNG